MKRLLASLVGILALAPGVASSAPSSFRNSVAAKAATALGERASLPVLVHAAAPGTDAVFETLLRRFNAPIGAIKTADAGAAKVTGNVKEARGKGWFLEVSRDGEVAHYRNSAEIENAGRGVALNERISDADAVSKANAFVSEALSSVVVLGEGETLEPWYVSYGISTSAPASATPVEPEKRVQAAKVVFTRAIDGIPVVGNGSKVTVLLKHDGTPIGFDLNWARLERKAGSKQDVIAADAANERIKTLSHQRSGGAQEVQKSKVECGLFDSGSASAGSKLQAACMHTYTLSLPASGLVPKTAWVDAVPVSRQVEKDTAWPESSLFVTP
ncbi:MAG: hypothetical protein ACOY0T_18190 [Myxococcota bacterium]